MFCKQNLLLYHEVTIVLVAPSIQIYKHLVLAPDSLELTEIKIVRWTLSHERET